MQILNLHEVPEYLSTVAQWLLDEWGQYIPGGSVARAEALLSMRPNAEGLPLSVVAVDDEYPVGVARLTSHDMNIRPMLSPWLASVFVLPTLRGRGIGTALCHEIVESARTLGFSELYLFTPDRASFYARQGWSPIETTSYRDKTVTVMQFKLDK